MLAKQLHRVNKLLRIIGGTGREMLASGFKKNKQCPICGNTFWVYWPYGVVLRDGAQCPCCRSLERHRTLWLYLEKNNLFAAEQMKVLHFAPEQAFLDHFGSKKNVDYWPVDINPDMPGIRCAADITDIPFEDESMDLIICNHVMEHILDEKKALSELRRVLKKGGIAVVNAPIDYSRETTFENPEYNTPELRLQHFGQHDHVRIYGRDYAQRLKEGGFVVEAAQPNMTLTPEELARYSVWNEDTIYLCRK